MNLDELEQEYDAKEKARIVRYPAGFNGKPLLGYFCESKNCSKCQVADCKCDCHLFDKQDWMGMC